MNDQTSELIEQMIESWGAQFEQLNNSERMYMLFCLAGTITASETDNYDPESVDGSIDSACERLHELSFSEQLGLAEALVSQIKTNQV